VTSILRVGGDPGYLSNKRMALEIAVGLAHLSGRRLALPVDEPIGWGPRPALTGEAAGPPSSLRDLYDLPVALMHDAGHDGPADGPARRPDWPDLAGAVLVDPPGVDRDDLEAFANGRTVIALDPTWVDDPVLEVPGRTLSYYSHFFLLDPEPRRQLFDLLEKIRLKEPYRELARVVGEELGDYNAAHIRRTDHLVGVPDYRRVMPWELRDNLAGVFRADQRLVVCTEADPASGFFAPLQEHFRDLVFLNDHLLGNGSTRGRFDALPRHDDSALAAVSQAVAVRAEGFVGTLSSTFTGIIQRERRLRDPGAPFLFTADFLRGPCRFEGCEYRAVREGPYSWNRLGYPVSPDALAWMREWPEVRS
jgi:hypothetical protein